MVFSGNPDEDAYAAPILVHSGDTLDLNGARLVASAGDNFRWNTDYTVIENNGGEIVHTFGGLVPGVENPNIEMDWSGSDNGENAAVSFDYNPVKSSAAAVPSATRHAAAGTLCLIRNRMSALTLASIRNPGIDISELRFADSGTMVSDAGYGFGGQSRNKDGALFVQPYLTRADQPSDGAMGYETGQIGFVAGYERSLSPSVWAGIHGGAGKMDLYFTGQGYSLNSEDIDIFSLGAHGSFSHENWHAQASSSVYTARHDYTGMTGLNLDIPEKDSYTTYGTDTAVTLGYGIDFGRMALLPEIGVSHSWIHGESHTTESVSGAWNTHYGSYDGHMFKSILGARFMGRWAHDGGLRVTPSAGLRWEEALGDSSIAVSQSLPGTNSIRVTDEIGDTSIVTDLSLLLAKENACVELSLVREDNDDYTAVGGSATFRLFF